MLLSGDIETNPGPAPQRQCPQCSCMVHVRKYVCTCGYHFIIKKSESKQRSLVDECTTIVQSPMKQCPHCGTAVPTRKRICVCGYDFIELDMVSEIAIKRRNQSRVAMTSLRATESPEDSMKRKSQSRVAMTSLRATESPEDSMRRKSQSRVAMASLRATESPEDSMKRKSQNLVAMAVNRSRVLSIAEAIAIFHSNIREGPDFVCTVCHRMMYRLGVVQYKRHKYTKGSSEMLHSVHSMEYVCTDGSQWICKTCDRTLMSGTLPVQAKANGFHLTVIPPELNCLNSLELRLICLRVPFMKMVALPTGKQRSIHGPAINVPSKLDSICTLLPRLPSQTDLIPLKLKRKLSHKGHYLFDYVSPDRLINAFVWLKTNNPLYAAVNINHQWMIDSLNDNTDLFNSLTGINNINEPVEVITDYDRHYNILVKMANEHSFVIHDVLGNGDCLFNAVAYQISDINASLDGAALRKDTVDFLRCNPHVNGNHLGSYLSNQVTEEYSVEDALISLIEDPDIQVQLRWALYLERLSDGAWGDHIAVQGISNMLNITINVFSTIGETITVVCPTSGTSLKTINIGLINQSHYVGLDSSNSSNDPSDDNKQTDVKCDYEEINDETIEEGDEHVRQITGGPPTCSVMSVENPESEGQVYSLAPAEGEHPINIMTDPKFELMCNPDKLPFGLGGFNSERCRKITYRKYFQQRLLDVDGRFSRDLDYLFTAQYIVESKQVFDDASHYIWRQRPATQLTAGQARDKATIAESIRKDKAYGFLKNVRGSPPYYQHTFYELLAMIRQLGTPTWFFTLSAADMKWPEVIQIIAKQYGVTYTDKDVAALSFEERCNWIRRNPVTAARQFQYRLDVFFKTFLKSTAHPLGEIADEAIRIEFQNRGSPHAHCVIWIKDAPRFGEHADNTVCDFIDKYVSCNLPNEDGRLKELILSVQQHKHSTYCKRNKRCRFNFPHPPSSSTLIAKEDTSDDIDIDVMSQSLAKVRKLLINGTNDVGLTELLQLAEVKHDDYVKALSITNKGNKIILKREPLECNINNYNPSVMLAWQANMDIQYVMDAYACVMYVASYIMKHEKSMGELLKNVANEVRTEELTTQLRKVGTAFLTHREVSAQEAVYRILSMPMKRLSRSVVFVDTNPINQRIAVLKRVDALSQLEDDNTDVFQKNLIDRYQHRPSELQTMCFAEFAATFTVDYHPNEDNNCDVLPPEEPKSISSKITLTGGFGKMNRRRHSAVIRFRRYNKDSDSINWHRAKLMLYYPWFTEDVDLLGGYSTYEEHYCHVQSVVILNEKNFTKSVVEDI